MNRIFNLATALYFSIALAAFGCATSSKECPPSCQSPNECCDGLCIAVANNNDNCGFCGYACREGTKCVSGECVETCGDAGAVCASTQDCCDGSCINVQGDVANCGSCGNACETGQVCTSGTCQTLTCEPACAEGETCCRVGTRNECHNLATDRNNCGGCGRVCTGLDEMCIDGTCSVEVCEPACQAGQSCCGGTCADKQSDMNNCGTCGNVCDETRANGCTAGQCSCMGALACRPDQKCCVGVGCRNVLTDPSNCGDCGVQCDIGETCADGTCMCGTTPACAETEKCCASTCIDVSADPMNCGGCATMCGDSGPDCVAGQCMCGDTPACPWSSRLWDCMMGTDYSMFQKCCDGVCMPMSDTDCGACGTACVEPQTCTCIFLVFMCQ
jgi:hypothetical protein